MKIICWQLFIFIGRKGFSKVSLTVMFFPDMFGPDATFLPSSSYAVSK